LWNVNYYELPNILAVLSVVVITVELGYNHLVFPEALQRKILVQFWEVRQGYIELGKISTVEAIATMHPIKYVHKLLFYDIAHLIPCMAYIVI